MIFIKPILDEIDAFDPRKDKTIYFSYTGNKVVENTLIIRKMSDSNSTQPVYLYTQTSNLLQHTIPANTLKSGECYKVRVYIKDSLNNFSAYSDEVLFQCFNTPTLSFINLSNNSKIETSSYIVQLNYNYDTSGSITDILSEYQVNVYYNIDCTRKVLSSTINYTYGNLDNLSSYIYNLENNQDYYLKAYGTTKYGMQAESDIIKINVQYNKPYIYTVLNAQVIKDNASVLLTSNIISMLGQTDDDNLTYVKDNGEIYTENDKILGQNAWVVLDKNNLGKTIIYENNFTLDGDYTLQLKCRNIPINIDFLTFYTKSGKMIKIKLMKSVLNSNKCYVEFKSQSDIKNSDYILYSDILTNDIINNCYQPELILFLQKKQGAYLFEVFDKGGDD